MEKYRVHEVAKDFGLPTKDIMEILTKYAQAPKNHMQALTDAELSVIFDYLTEKNPVSGIQVIFADTAKEEKKAEPKSSASLARTYQRRVIPPRPLPVPQAAAGRAASEYAARASPAP